MNALPPGALKGMHRGGDGDQESEKLDAGGLAAARFEAPTDKLPRKPASLSPLQYRKRVGSSRKTRHHSHAVTDAPARRIRCAHSVVTDVPPGSAGLC